MFHAGDCSSALPVLAPSDIICFADNLRVPGGRAGQNARGKRQKSIVKTGAACSSAMVASLSSFACQGASTSQSAKCKTQRSKLKTGAPMRHRCHPSRAMGGQEQVKTQSAKIKSKSRFRHGRIAAILKCVSGARTSQNAKRKSQK